MPETDRLFETIANYTYDWETWFDAGGRPLWINPAVERMTGYDVAACRAMPDYPLPLVHAEDRATVAAQLASAAGGSIGNDLEFRLLHRDGSLLWGAVSWQTLRDAAGNPLGFRTSVRDITGRKQMEHTLAGALREAEAAGRAKSRFLAAASHDLRQPIQSALLLAAALARRVHDAEAAGIVDSLRTCLRSTDELLDALLDVSRLDAGTLRAEPRVVLLADHLERLEAEFDAQARERGLTLRVVASSAAVMADPAMLDRVLDNLVANAVHHTEQGRVLVGVRRRGDALLVEVHDSGPGIAEPHLSRIFEEFYQAGNAQRDRRQGLGLGLAIVRRMTRLMQAEVGVRSTPGRGSVFWLRLPRAAAETGRRAPRASLPGSASLHGTRIAVVDDEPAVLEALAGYLRDLGAEVLAADSPRELDRLLEGAQSAPHLLLADYRLQDGCTGMQLVQTLRQRFCASLPALLLSGDTEPDRLREAAAGGVRLLHKPIDADELLRVLREALAS